MRADAAASPFGEHGHAPDRMIRREAAGADRTFRGVARDHVARAGILRIPFVFDRNLLLDDKNLLAHRAQCFEIGRPVRGLDAEILGNH